MLSDSGLCMCIQFRISTLLLCWLLILGMLHKFPFSLLVWLLQCKGIIIRPFERSMHCFWNILGALVCAVGMNQCYSGGTLHLRRELALILDPCYLI